MNHFSIFRSFKFLSFNRLCRHLIPFKFLFSPGFADAAYEPLLTHPYAFPTTPVAVTPHPGHAALVPQTPNPYAHHYGYAATVGKKK